MRRQRPYTRAMLAFLLATGPMATACEMAFDFDRTPLQPIYEAGAYSPDATGTGPGSPPRDGGGGGPGREDARPETGPEDAGTDAEQDT